MATSSRSRRPSRRRPAARLTGVRAQPLGRHDHRGRRASVRHDHNGWSLSRDGCHVVYWGFFVGFFGGLLVIPPRWSIFTWNPCTNTAPINVSPASLPPLTAAGSVRGPLAVSADGRYVAYIAQNAGTSTRVGRIDTNTPGTENPLTNGVFNANTIDITDNGAFLAIGGQTTINDLTRNAVVGWTPPCNLQTSACNTELIAAGNTGQNASEINYNPSLSSDGRFVAFTSNVPPGAAALTTRQVYVRDRSAAVTKLVTSSPGQPMPGDVDDAEISPDGSQIALGPICPAGGRGQAGPRGLRGSHDVGLLRPRRRSIWSSYGVNGGPTTTDSAVPSMSSNGRFVAFASGANNELSGVATPGRAQRVDARTTDRP